MAGGGGNAPPPTNGGEFLLHLLKNPPRQSHSDFQQIPPQPSQTLSHDPAVAAVGPSIPFPTNGIDYQHPLHTPLFTPPNYFNRGLGFPQNPNPNPNPNWALDFMHNRPINNLGALDDLAKLRIITNQQPEQPNKLVFGSLHSEIDISQLKGKSDYNLGNSDKQCLNRNAEYNRNFKIEFDPPAFGNYGSMEAAVTQQVRRMPPPGFLSKSRTGGKRNSENNVYKGKGNHREGTSSNGGFAEGKILHLGDEKGVARQLHEPGPSSGNNLHSISGSDIEESLMAVHETDGEDGRKPRDNGLEKRELDDLEEYVDRLVLEDGEGERNDIKKQPKSRDKDYRSDKRGQWLLNQRMRNYRRQTECRGDINRLNAQFLTIYESLIPSEEEKEKQKQLLALLGKHVTKEWQGAQLFLYGSCANSFGFRKSDIDVCLSIGELDVNKSEILLKLADILKSDNLENVQALTHARVPIVKLMDPATGISCDICVNNLLAVVNTKLLRDYSKIDTRLRQLAFIVKHWAKSRGVNETYKGTLSSYAYVLMCIHFLQQRTPSILPCLQGMERTYVVTVDDVECSYFDQVEKLYGFGSRNGESIAQLVWAFFNYWAYCHDYANDVISVRTGTIVSKRAKDWTRRIGNDRHLICIEDPFEVSHDLGRVVDRRSIRVLREEFERAAEIMQYDPNPCVKLFEPYVPN